ncbi:polyadenylate-binding protein-interacting protein 11 [Nicotiana tabacum]|uniref:Polyadenylate-binding protein-interacting protein 11 n=2 Tax=Nicotiana TaxID=4085 RepID=A0A1S3Y4A5_TOBAC|nr:PREDICTED: polyadenylate-binding protein-interacting protein 11-like [Nicotiana sylvestris]XP_016446989.1 PREDICTED: polyadenylate-binding protein-interacting protein 11-like [Nicotiana tabacum]
MAVGENGSLNRTDGNDSAAVDHQSNQNGGPRSTLPIDQNLQMKTTVRKPQMDVFQQQQQRINDNGVLSHHHNLQHKKMNGVDEEGFNSSREMRELEEMFSKLNPMAAEFVPPSLSSDNYGGVVPFLPGGEQFGFDAFNLAVQAGLSGNGISNIRKRNGYGHGRRRMNGRTTMAQREEVIRRTVYVSDIDHQVTEEQLATLFLTCGQVVDCRICGDPNSLLRFAFIEFIDEEGARNALSLAGTMLGFYPVRVLPSKTAIAPVNPKFLPRSEDEREMCARTIYCTNIDTKVTQGDVKLFFESFCGEVKCLRLLGDYRYSTRIAFVEFVMAESAIAALNCSGAILGSLPIRVSPSKTPVRPRAPRPAVQ